MAINIKRIGINIDFISFGRIFKKLGIKVIKSLKKEIIDTKVSLTVFIIDQINSKNSAISISPF
jgi:hypothetical protein